VTDVEPKGAEAGDIAIVGLDWCRPSARLVAVRRAQIATAAVPFLLLGLLIPLLAGAGWVALVLALLVVAGCLVADLLFGRRIRSWRYAEREDDLILERGLLFTKLTIVPYGRMQFVDVVAGPFERAFGIASVHLHTAAAATDARIPGLSAQEAVRLRDALTSLGEARAAGL
jgi:membrane protein YdbS with pleckstrin-like domain